MGLPDDVWSMHVFVRLKVSSVCTVVNLSRVCPQFRRLLCHGATAKAMYLRRGPKLKILGDTVMDTGPLFNAKSLPVMYADACRDAPDLEFLTEFCEWLHPDEPTWIPEARWGFVADALLLWATRFDNTTLYRHVLERVVEPTPRWADMPLARALNDNVFCLASRSNSANMVRLLGPTQNITASIIIRALNAKAYRAVSELRKLANARGLDAWRSPHADQEPADIMFNCLNAACVNGSSSTARWLCFNFFTPASYKMKRLAVVERTVTVPNFCIKIALPVLERLASLGDTELMDRYVRDNAWFVDWKQLLSVEDVDLWTRCMVRGAIEHAPLPGLVFAWMVTQGLPVTPDMVARRFPMGSRGPMRLLKQRVSSAAAWIVTETGDALLPGNVTDYQSLTCLLGICGCVEVAARLVARIRCHNAEESSQLIVKLLYRGELGGVMDELLRWYTRTHTKEVLASHLLKAVERAPHTFVNTMAAKQVPAELWPVLDVAFGHAPLASDEDAEAFLDALFCFPKQWHAPLLKAASKNVSPVVIQAIVAAQPRQISREVATSMLTVLYTHAPDAWTMELCTSLKRKRSLATAIAHLHTLRPFPSKAASNKRRKIA